MLNKKVKHNKLRPMDENSIDKSIVIRFSKDTQRKRVQLILEKEVCQVCDESYNLDMPHHAIYGLGVKDDRFQVNICTDCHRTIHSGSYDDLKKTREEIEQIGWNNHLEIKGKQNGK